MGIKLWVIIIKKLIILVVLVNKIIECKELGDSFFQRISSASIDIF